jgi:hypothetical protein
MTLHEKTVDLFLNNDGNGHNGGAAAENALTELARKNGAAGNQYHRTFKRWLKRLIQDAPSLTDQQRKRTVFWADQIIISLAPQNYFWSNPSAVKAFLDSHGKSLENSCISDRLLLLQGRQHHPAAAGPGLDPRPLRQR